MGKSRLIVNDENETNNCCKDTCCSNCCTSAWKKAGTFLKDKSVYKYTKSADGPPPKLEIHSKCLGHFRLVVLLFQAFVAVGAFTYFFVFQHGYQNFSGLDSFVRTDVYGIFRENYTIDQKGLSSANRKKSGCGNGFESVLDDVDYIFPAEQSGSIFVETNIITTDQTQTTCAEGASVEDAHCISGNNQTTEKTCKDAQRSKNGFMTGLCLENQLPSGDGLCEIEGWCPTQENNMGKQGTNHIILTDTENLTIRIINNILFDMYSIRTQNIKMMSDGCSVLNNCTYDAMTAPFCPIFQLGDIVRRAGGNYSKMVVMGGVILIYIKWDCNLDFGGINKCSPSYHFSLLNDNYEDCQEQLQYYKVLAFNYQDNSRTLLNATGIYFLIQVDGLGRRFDLRATFLTLIAVFAMCKSTDWAFKGIMWTYNCLSKKCCCKCSCPECCCHVLRDQGYDIIMDNLLAEDAEEKEGR